MSFKTEHKIREFWVVFQDAIRPHWWDCISDGDMKHCWAYHTVYFPEEGLMADRYAMKVEVSESRISTEAWWADPDVITKHFAPSVIDILKVRVEIDDRVGYIPRGPLTCVSGIKALLGMQAWWVLTPLQLHKHLVRRGAVSVID